MTEAVKGQKNRLSVGLYLTDHEAREGVEALFRAGFDRRKIALAMRPSEEAQVLARDTGVEMTIVDENADTASLVERLSKAGLAERQAARYAAEVQRGRVLLVIRCESECDRTRPLLMGTGAINFGRQDVGGSVEIDFPPTTDGREAERREGGGELNPPENPNTPPGI
jgi:hypothetical protein